MDNPDVENSAASSAPLEKIDVAKVLDTILTDNRELSEFLKTTDIKEQNVDEVVAKIQQSTDEATAAREKLASIEVLSHAEADKILAVLERFRKLTGESQVVMMEYTPEDETVSTKINPLIQVNFFETTKFVGHVISLLPQEHRDRLVEIENLRRTWTSLVEVHPDEGQHIDSIIFAKRQAEILRSRAVLERMNREGQLSRQWGVSEEDAIQILKDSISYEITEGGLIKLQCLCTKFSVIDGRSYLTKLLGAYSSLRNERKKGGLTANQHLLERQIRAMEDKVEGRRRTYFKFLVALTREKYENPSEVSLSKLRNELNFEDLDFYEVSYNALVDSRANLKRLKFELENIHQQPAFRYLTIHSYPHIK